MYALLCYATESHTTGVTLHHDEKFAEFAEFAESKYNQAAVWLDGLQVTRHHITYILCTHVRITLVCVCSSMCV